MSQISLPNQLVFNFYEGANPEQYSRLTGSNLNRAPKAIQENVKLLAEVCDGIAGFADEYDADTAYSHSQPVKYQGVTYLSRVDNNSGNLPTNPTFWVPLPGNINDQLISESTSWSSSRIQSEILAMAIALG